MNKYMKTALTILAAIILSFGGFYYGEQYGKNEVPTPASTSTSTQVVSQNDYYSNVAEWQSDSNNNLFSVAYPIDFNHIDNYSTTPSTDWRVNSNNVPGTKYFTLTIPKAFEPQTNFADATLTVGGSRNNVAISQCMTPDQSGGPNTSTSTATISGVEFTVFNFSDAGAGNYYQTTSYRALHGEECFAVEYTIHSSQIGNYPSSYNLKPFDQQKIDSLLKDIIGTFKFL